MTTIKPLHDKVLGYMLEPLGSERTSAGGVIIQEDHGSDDFVRPRWFVVTAVGPEQEDIAAGDYVLVPHGRWSQGINLEGSMQEEDKIFLVDHKDILGTSDDNPIR